MKKIFGTAFRFDDRKLILEADGFRFLLVRNQDVPAYVLHQSADIGVVGLDVLEEKDEDLLRLLIWVLENVRYVWAFKRAKRLITLRLNSKSLLK